MTRRAAWITGAACVALVMLVAVTAIVAARRSDPDATRVDIVSGTAPISQVVVTIGSTAPTTTVATTIAPTTLASTTTTVAAPSTTLTSTTTTSTTTTTTTTVPTTPPPPPGRLDVKVHELDFGPDRTAGSVTVTNIGGRPVAWTTSSDNALLQAPGRGTLGPGASAGLTISVSRSGLIEGDYTGVVSITGGGRGLAVTVRWTVERTPVVQVDLKPPDLDDAGTCPPRSPALTTVVSAAVIDESAVASVTMVWSGPGAGGNARLAEIDPGTWTAPLGPLTGPGSWTLSLKATDARGNVGSGSTTFLVNACPP
jgi:hypothetical protein